MLAIAKMVDGEISDLFSFNDFSSSDRVVFSPGLTSQNRSVLDVHSTITVSTPECSLKSLYFVKIKFLESFSEVIDG